MPTTERLIKNMQRRILFIWFVLISGIGNAQASFIKCPVDTNSIFEMGIKIFQLYDSLGKIELRTSIEYAIPNFTFPEEFIHTESKEKCTPFPIGFENNQIYIFDSVAYSIDSNGKWKFDFDLSKKVLLSQTKILSLKIEIRNETDKNIDLSKIDLLQNLNLPLQILEITFFLHNPAKTKLKIKKWKFIQYPNDLNIIRLDVPINQKRKQVLRSLSRFKKLEKIEIHGNI